MKGSMGTGLILVGFVLLWIALSGRMDCFFQFVQCLTSGKGADPSSVGQPQGATSGFSLPVLPKLPVLS